MKKDVFTKNYCFTSNGKSLQTNLWVDLRHILSGAIYLSISLLLLDGNLVESFDLLVQL